MSDQERTNSSVMILPPFGKSPELKLDMKNIREAEVRLVEAKNVNPVTYPDLENCFNQSYRDLKRHLSSVGYSLSMAKKALDEAKADVILGSYQEFMQGKPKSHDNADMRAAFLIKDQNYSACLDRIAQLEALNSNLEGKVKVMERVTAFMRQQMQLLIRSGLTNSNLYITSGK